MCAMARRRRRSIGSDYTSDEEFELGGSEGYEITSEDEEMDDSDALSDADADKEEEEDEEEEESPDSEVEDDADYEEEEEDDDDFVVDNPGSRMAAKKKSLRTFGGGEKRGFSGKKSRGRPRKEPVVPEEEEEEEEDEYEYEDDSDEDFSPDEEENEEVVRITIRKRTVTRKGSGRRRGRGRRRGNSRSVELEEEDEYGDEDEGGGRRNKKRSTRGRTGKMRRRQKGGKDGVGAKRSERKKRRRKKVERKTGVGKVRGRGRRRTVTTSDDDDDLDFVVEDAIPARGRGSGVGSRKLGNVGKRRVQREMDPLDRDSSDFENAASVQELRYLPFVNANCKKRRTERVPDKEKGKGKEIEDSGKQVCGICLSEERKGVARGVLNSCAHYFCFACIMEWSKVESRCPVCKQRFRTISKTLASNTILGLRPTIVRVPKRDQIYQPSEEELWGFLNPYENVVCMECLQGGDDGLMLLCDLCDSPAHTYCVGLGRDVPEGDWYCSACRSVEGGQVNSHARDSENTRVSNNGGVTSYATSDRLAPLHEILEQPIPRGSNSGLSPHIPLPETIGVARASGPSALTLSGRRALSQRIRILFSSGNRARNLVSPRSPGTNVAQFGPLDGDVANSENGQRQRAALPDELSPYNGWPQRRGICDLNSPPTPCASYEDSHL